MDSNNNNSNTPTDPNQPVAPPPPSPTGGSIWPSDAPATAPVTSAPPAFEPLPESAPIPQPEPPTPSFTPPPPIMSEPIPEPPAPVAPPPPPSAPPTGGSPWDMPPAPPPPAPPAPVPAPEPMASASPFSYAPAPAEADNSAPPSWTSAPTDQNAMPPTASPVGETPPFNTPAPATSPMTEAVPTADSSPTDLSHLVSATDNPPSPIDVNAATPMSVSQPTPVSAPETQVVASSGGFPKWIFAVGVVILLVVIGASAYFILGVGKQETATAPLPIEQTTTVAPKTIVPPQNMQNSTDSANNLSSLKGSTTSGVYAVEPTGTGSAQSGSSAIDLLRKRTATPTP